MNALTAQERLEQARQWLDRQDHSPECGYWQDETGTACSCGYRQARVVLSAQVFTPAEVRDGTGWAAGWLFLGLHRE